MDYVIGADFGSDSVRVVVLNAADGRTAGSASAVYPRWSAGLYQHPEKNVFRQHPLDYLEAFEAGVKAALDRAGDFARTNVRAIGIDATGSTPCPVDRDGVPLAMKEPFEQHEGAMFHLWKDHSAAAEAKEIQGVFSGFGGQDYTRYQGDYCSEWFWAKILHTSRQYPEIREHAYSWVEHSDWLPAVLCGNTAPERAYRCACGAGHKALWHSSWNGLPDEDCLRALDPCLLQVRNTYRQPRPADVPAGVITAAWAAKLGLPENVVIGGSSFDAHAGAVGAGIRRGVMVSNMGTSAVDMLVETAQVLEGKKLRHVCGQAEDSIIPGLVGIETGQAAFGDVYAWFKRLLLWPVRLWADEKATAEAQEMYRELEENVLSRLSEAAQRLPDAAGTPVALDWFNGRRYPHTDDFQKAAIAGLDLGSTAPAVYRSLVLGSVCGLRRILDELESGGLKVEEIIAVGGIAKKSPFVMKTMANLLERPVKVAESTQTCAVGAAIYGAVGAGLYPGIPEAQERMCPGYSEVWRPDQDCGPVYRDYYAEYLRLAGKF